MKHLTGMIIAVALAMPAASAFGLQRMDLPMRQMLSSERYQLSTRVLTDSPNSQSADMDIITEPKGTVVYYTKSSAGTFVFQGEIFMYKEEFPAILIYGENNTVYFKNIISTYPDEYYVKGTISDNTITVKTNQTIEFDREGGYGVNFGVFRTVPFTDNGEEFLDFEYAPEIESIEFNIHDDGSISMHLPGEPFNGEEPTEYIAALYYDDDYSFTGFSDFSQEYSLLEIEMVTIPDNLPIEKYISVDSYNYAYAVDVAHDDEYLYIRGLTSQLPEATLKAKLDGNKAWIPQNEYMGIYFDMDYIFTKVLYDNPDFDPEDPESEMLVFAPDNVEFELNVDFENGLIWTDKEGVYLSFHGDFTDIYNTLGLYGIFQLKRQSVFGGIPADPVSLSYTTKFAEYQGFNDLFFTIPNFSTDGNMLYVDNIYYSVYINDQIQVFESKVINNLNGIETICYSQIPFPIDKVPYGFDNFSDVTKFMENDFDIGIYTNDVETIGVQSVYLNDDGQLTYSNIVTLNIETGEITTKPYVDNVVEIDMDNVVSTEYYTLDGRKVLNPERGLYIRVLTDANSNKAVSKIVM